jgi:MraZ protein
MLIGEYVHTLDDKKRLSLPAKFRKALGKGAIVTRGLDHCLSIYSAESWKGIMTKMGALSLGAVDSRGFTRFMLSGAAELEVDSAGRVLIPEHLRHFAHFKSKVVFAGAGDRVEVWDDEKWTLYKKHIEHQGDTMAERLGEVGAL